MPVLRRKIGLHVSMDKWIPSRGIVLNLILFSAILPILYWIHQQPWHENLVFAHDDFVLYTLWTSAYAHLNDGHLYNNLYGYVMAIIPVWLMFSYYYRQWVIRRVYLIILAVFPVLISLSSYVIYKFGFGVEGTVTRGFSGIGAAVFGLLFVAILKITYDDKWWQGVFGIGMAVVLVTMIRMLIRGGAVDAQILILGLIAGVLSLSLVIPREALRIRTFISNMSKRAKADTLLVIYGGGDLMYVLPAMFPLNWVREDQIVNIFGHLSGLVLGIIAGIVVFYWVTPDPESLSQTLESSTQ